MASEWARVRAEELVGFLSQPMFSGLPWSEKIGVLAADLDAARREGEERERWECHLIAASEVDYCGDESEDFCPRCGSHIADAISARGPMRGPEEE